MQFANLFLSFRSILNPTVLRLTAARCLVIEIAADGITKIEPLTVTITESGVHEEMTGRTESPGMRNRPVEANTEMWKIGMATDP